NPATGTAAILGDLGFNSSGDLAFVGGQLYLSATNNHLIRINLAGVVSGTDVGPFGFNSVFGLATADNGVLYGVAGVQAFSVNPGTGDGTLAATFGGHGLSQVYGSSFITEALIKADFDENHVVAAADLAIWKSGFGRTSGATHMQGDANGDGAVTGADF